MKFSYVEEDLSSDNFDPTRDVGSVREYAFGKNKIIAERKDPYGLWFLHFEHGTVPEMLSGSFTSLSFAETAINSYFAKKNLEDADVKDAKPRK